MIVVSESGKVKYSIFSEELKRKVYKEQISFLNNGDSLSKLSFAYDFLKTGKNLASDIEENGQVDLGAWFNGFDYSRYDCSEHSIYSKYFQQVISLIWLSEKSDSVEEDEEDFL